MIRPTRSWSLLPEVVRASLDGEGMETAEEDSAGRFLSGGVLLGRGYCLTMSSSSTSKTNVAPGLMTGGEPRSP